MNEKIKREIEEIISSLFNLNLGLEHQELYAASAVVSVQIIKLRKLANYVS
jgi:hypothetical protein